MGCLGKYSVKNSEDRLLSKIRKQPLLDYSAVVSDKGGYRAPLDTARTYLPIRSVM